MEVGFLNRLGREREKDREDQDQARGQAAVADLQGSGIGWGGADSFWSAQYMEAKEDGAGYSSPSSCTIWLFLKCQTCLVSHPPTTCAMTQVGSRERTQLGRIWPGFGMRGLGKGQNSRGEVTTVEQDGQRVISELWRNKVGVCGRGVGQEEWAATDSKAQPDQACAFKNYIQHAYFCDMLWFSFDTNKVLIMVQETVEDKTKKHQAFIPTCEWSFSITVT